MKPSTILNTCAERQPEARRPRLRVALVIYRDSAGWGGAYRVAHTLASNLAAEGVEPHLVFAYGEPGPVGQSAKFGCEYLRASGPKDLPAWRRARRLMRRLRPDLIHFVEPVIWLNAALLGIGIPKLWYGHGKVIVEHTSWLNLNLLRLVGRLNDGCVCISEGARQNLIGLGLARPEACWTIYNSVDVERFEQLPSRAEARGQLRLPADAKVLGMVCRLFPDKGCADALELLSRLDPGWLLMFVGEGSYRSELERLVKAKGLQERVRFTGALGDVRPAYAAMDAYLFLSRYESFGLVLAEAMAAGVPVFGLGALGEYREPEYPLVRPDNAVFVERANPEEVGAESPAVLDELAGRILHFEDHPELYDGMVERARAWVKERFDAPLQARAMAAVYARVLGVQPAVAGESRSRAATHARRPAGLTNGSMQGAVTWSTSYLPAHLLQGLRQLGWQRGLARAAGRLGASIPVEFGPVELQMDLSSAHERHLFLGLQERDVLAVFQALLRPGDTVIDAGAHIGFHSAYMAQIVGPQGRVYSVEPNPAVQSRILHMAEGNPLRNIELVPAAISDRSGEAVFHVSRDPGLSSLLSSWSPTTTVEELRVKTITLDELIEKLPGKRIRLIKIDVEGHEAAAFRGLRRSLERGVVDAIVFEVAPQDKAEARLELAGISDMLQEYGYAVWGITPQGLLDHSLVRENPSLLYPGYNLLATRAELP